VAIGRTRPDVVISFMDRTNVLVLLATVGARRPVFVADRTAADPASGRIWRTLRRITYRRATAVVVQTEASAKALDERLRRRAVAIPNPVLDEPADAATTAASGESHLVVALGRLVPQKGFDLLIDAFASVVRDVPDARLEIWGDGPERASLAAAIERRGLGGCAILAGETRQPAAVLGRSEIFVLSSRIEGFPNVLIEAMALGRPVVAFDCTFGPAEIVRDGLDGLLVPAGDVDGLGAAIVRLLTEPETRVAIGRRAVEVRERFALPGILARWSELVDARVKR
jgi:glycosyltransferase involved in cell wall biosynthesis